MVSIRNFLVLLDRFTLLEEVNDSDVPMEPLHYPVSAPLAGMEHNQPPAESYGGQICAAKAQAACQREDSPQASAQSIGKAVLELQDEPSVMLRFKKA